jgi:hypothetical protein
MNWCFWLGRCFEVTSNSTSGLWCDKISRIAVNLENHVTLIISDGSIGICGSKFK